MIKKPNEVYQFKCAINYSFLEYFFERFKSLILENKRWINIKYLRYLCIEFLD